VVNGTINLRLPPWLEHVVGAANLGLPRTLSISIPRYHAAAAYAELRAKLAPYLTEGDLLNPRLLLNLATSWTLYDEGRRRYITFDGADAGVAAAAGEGGADDRQQPRAAAA
jgi:hypothetical protein